MKMKASVDNCLSWMMGLWLDYSTFVMFSKTAILKS